MLNPPELQILILNGIILAVAYLGIYPSLREKSIARIMGIDMALTGIILLIAAGWFWGTGLRFSLILFETNWGIFTLATLFVMEVPAFLWFAKRYGIPLDGKTHGDD